MTAFDDTAAKLVEILELCSQPLPEPPPSATGMPGLKDLTRMLRRRLADLRAAGTREIYPGFPANVLAEGLAEELEEDERLAQTLRSADVLREEIRRGVLLRLKSLLHLAKQQGMSGEQLARLNRAMRKAQGRRRGRR